MHTISETGHTGDVLSAIWSMVYMLEDMDEQKVTCDTFKQNHARLDTVSPVSWSPVPEQQEN